MTSSRPARSFPPGASEARGVRILVVGAGVAGTAAALAAARVGAQVRVLDGGSGASTLATGALDLAPWHRPGQAALELPPLALAVLAALGVHVLPERGSLVLTTAGLLRPARGHDAALLDVGPLAGRRVGVIRCGRPAWDADALVGEGGRDWISIEARVLRHSDERAIPDADFAARHDDDARLGWLAERLREALSTASAGGAVAGLVLPPSLGVDRPRAQALSERVGVPCGEPVAMPGGPSGLRFERARDRAFAAAGIERTRARASRVERADGSDGARERWRITTSEGASLDADAVVLATGGLLGGGIEYTPAEAIVATALPPRPRPPLRASIDAPVSVGAYGRPLEVPGSLFGLAPEQIAWPFVPDGLLERAGILVDEGDRCTGAPVGLFAAGELVADAPHAWLRALISGARAGVAAARSSASPPR